MANVLYRDPGLEWLDHVQPVGLVVAPSVLKELGLTPLHQSPVDTAEAAEHINPDEAGPALPDPWAFMQQVLGWNAAHVAGAPGGPELPGTLVVSLPEHATTLTPTWAVTELGQNGQPWQLLVRIEAAGIAPDGRAQLDGWEASPHQRFERLLRDTGIFAGLLITDRELRLVYAPRGETSGYLAFPLRPLGMVAGRPMLGGLKLLLDSFRLFSDADERRLPALLKKSRDAQASVSTELAGQVLGALHELLRGLNAADADLIRELAASKPDHLYEGLLTVLMRLVFILYAEDRDLLPSRADARARAVYETSYSVRGLYARLVEDAALNPDTMDERRGGWGQLLALFRLIHKGHPSHFVQARGGKLFDPDEFPFLEGRKAEGDAPRILNVSDGCLLRILEGLMTLKLRGHERERLSYRTLDVEQIGSVYETVMGFTVEAARSSVLAIKAGKNNRTPVFVALDELLARKGKDRIKDLKENVGRSLTASQEKPVEAAKSVEELAAAFEGMVDERGSPRHVMAPTGTPILQPTDERRRTGSHYTPRSLTQPIVAHALEPAFERLGLDATPEQILDLKVCDPAMGSGAFLVEACRAIASRLVAAWSRWPETRPTIPADEDEELHARRLVAQRCLYGVDKNPRAVDLAKLSLWLATLAKDHEFTFLDHALKCGDSLVGLDAAQIAAMHWDTSKPGLPLFRQFVADRVAEATKASAEIRSAPDDTMRAILEQKHRFVESRVEHVRVLGDAVLSAFFVEDKPKAREKRRATIESWVAGIGAAKWDDLRAAAASLCAGEHPVRPFHWSVEFPEVFMRDNPGFDAMVGNPPFLGGRKLSTAFGDPYADAIRILILGKKGSVDLVGYFLALFAKHTRNEGQFGLVATSSLAEGESRATALRPMLLGGYPITWARRKAPWPGEAGVHVVQLSIKKGQARGPFHLDGMEVAFINSRLEPDAEPPEPTRLYSNRSFHSDGIKVQGIGFVISSVEAGQLIRADARNSSVVWRYVTGDDLNSLPNADGSRWIINFGNMDEGEARRFVEPFRIVEERVKPYRDRLTRQVHEASFWKFWDRREEFFACCAQLQRVIVMSKLSKYRAVTFGPTGRIYSEKVKVFASDDAALFGILQSQAHQLWSLREGATTGETPAYSGSKCFDTFALPLETTFSSIRTAASTCYERRQDYCTAHAAGLTDFYNRFHAPDERSGDFVRLREFHAEMDRAVLEAYGWHDLAERAAPIFLDDSNEEDHTYQGRLFWPSDFRDEVLARLLALNAERHAEEVRLGIAPGMKGQPEAEDDEEASEEELTE